MAATAGIQKGDVLVSANGHRIRSTSKLNEIVRESDGKAVELAKSLRAALAETKTPLNRPAALAAATETPAFVKTVEEILGAKGRFAGGVLSFGIPFAVLPLVMLTSNRRLMGSDTNHPVTTVVGWAIGLLVSVLNMVLIYLTVKGH